MKNCGREQDNTSKSYVLGLGWTGLDTNFEKPSSNLTRQALREPSRDKEERKPNKLLKEGHHGKNQRSGVTWKEADRAAKNRVRWRNVIHRWPMLNHLGRGA
jgi:hypothetical protein